MGTKFTDLAGQTFGKLTVLSKAPTPRGKRAFWRCVCECGSESVKMGKYLINGDTRSCGCEQRAMRQRGNGRYRGLATKGTREYTIWRSMKSRCHVASSSNFRFYGARGITVCDRWRDDFRAFLSDMGACPLGYTLDRIDPSGNYTPDNCRWADWTQQRSNKRNSIYVTINGQRETLVGQLRTLGLTHEYHAIHDRLTRRGMTFHEAIRDIGHDALLSSSSMPGAR